MVIFNLIRFLKGFVLSYMDWYGTLHSYVVLSDSIWACMEKFIGPSCVALSFTVRNHVIVQKIVVLLNRTLQFCCELSQAVFNGKFNPLSPGVLDPGNYLGGPQDPQLYFAFLGLFYAL